MKRVFRPLLALALPLACLTPLPGALDTNIVGADAQWVMHLDLNSLRKSTIGQEIVKQIAAMQVDVGSSPLQVDAARLLEMIGTITAYGANLSQDPKQVDGALIFQGTTDLIKIAKGFAAQATVTTPEKLTEITDLPFEAYSVGGELIVAFPPEPIILASKSKAQLLKARDVFRGEAESLAKASDSSLRDMIRDEAGCFVLAASMVPSGDFFPSDAPQARILQMAKSASLELGEAGGQTFAHVQLLASSDEMADKLVKILQGIAAMVSLAETSDKALADFLRSLSVTREKNTVTLRLTYASEQLVAMIHEAQAAQKLQRERGPESGVERDVTNGPIPPVEEPVIARWQADQDLGDFGVSPKTLVSQTIPNVALGAGSIIVLTGHRDAGENARFDYVEITPSAGGVARRVEAEDMELANYTILNNRHGSGGKLIQSHDSHGTARFPFTGDTGRYTLTVRYADESDGKSSFFVSVMGATEPRTDGGDSPRAAPAPGHAPTAEISHGLGRFYFPIENIDRQWQWQAAPTGSMEYQWSIKAKLRDGMYRFGFSRFCFPSKKKSAGTFEELLASGQVDVWKENPDLSLSLQTKLTGITAKRQGDGLLIEFTEARLLESLAAERPATLTFDSGAALYSGGSAEIQVIYR